VGRDAGESLAAPALRGAECGIGWDDEYFRAMEGVEAFDPLKGIVHNVFEDCGIAMHQKPDGTLHIWIKDGKLPM
jgi:hypothetical protein